MTDLRLPAHIREDPRRGRRGGRYHVTCTGWRFQPFSWYRNIVSIERV